MIMESVIVTIIIPVYNTERYIERCITSVLHQTYTRMEIILIDDGSNDRSLAMCEYYKNVDHRIKVYSTSHHGVTMARYYGIMQSKGDILVFCDSDDWIEEDYVESVCRPLINCPRCDMVISGFIMDHKENNKFYFDSLKDGVIDKDEIEKIIIPHFLWDDNHQGFLFNPSLAGKAYRKEKMQCFFDDIDKEIIFNEDGIINLIYLMSSEYIYNEKYAGYHYVYRKDSCCHTPLKSIGLLLGGKVHDEYVKLLRPFIETNEIERQFNNRFNETILWHISASE